jgi:hypothetical protein
MTQSTKLDGVSWEDLGENVHSATIAGCLVSVQASPHASWHWSVAAIGGVDGAAGHCQNEGLAKTCAEAVARLLAAEINTP